MVVQLFIRLLLWFQRIRWFLSLSWSIRVSWLLSLSLLLWPKQVLSANCMATHIPWIIDSGSYNHMTSSTSVISDVSISRRLHQVTLADGSTLQINGLVPLVCLLSFHYLLPIMFLNFLLIFCPLYILGSPAGKEDWWWL